MIIPEDRRAPRFPVRVVAVRKADGTELGSTASAIDGQFALDLPALAPNAAVEIQARGRDDRVLGSTETETERTLRPVFVRVPTLDADVALPPAAPAGLVDRERTAALRRRVRDLETEGQLPVGASTTLDAALRPLEWASELRDTAHGTLDGDPHAAARLRIALLARSPHPRAVESSEIELIDCCTDDEDNWSGDDDTLTDVAALLPVAVAAIQAAEDGVEQQQLLDGLATALWSRPWVDAFERAVVEGDMGGAQLLMGGGGMPGMPGGLPGGGLPGGGLPGGGGPGGGLPGGGLPGGPGSPWEHVRGKRKVPVHRDPRIADLAPHLYTPITQVPTAAERCLIGAMVEVARIERSLPRWEITGLEPVDACPGNVLVITGGGFGTRGRVVFPGTAPPVDANDTLSWSDTRIELMVPAGAAPGMIRLRIFERRLLRCGQVFDIYRPGESRVSFAGGTPAIESLWIDQFQGDAVAAPNTDVVAHWTATDHPTVRTQLTVRQGATVLYDSGPLPGGVRTTTFRTPHVSIVTEVEVRLEATGTCGTQTVVRRLFVAAQPRLKIEHVEVVQGTQRADNSVRLVAQRTTAVRVYITTGLVGFTYVPGSSDSVPNVTATVTLRRSGQLLASEAPAAPLTATNNFLGDTSRTASNLALNFLLPLQVLEGDIDLTVLVRVDPRPTGMLDGPGATAVRSVSVRFHPRRHLTLVRWRLRDEERTPVLPAPTVAQWRADVSGSADRYPVSNLQWFESVLPGWDELNTAGHDLTSREGWQELIDDLDDIADRFSEYGQIYVCVAPNDNAYALNGIAHDYESFNWPASDDHAVMIVQNMRPASYAHEMAHTLGFGHAPCGDPERIDSRLPGMTEAGTVGWRPSDGRLIPPGWAELMSYCTPPTNNYQDRWPSAAWWEAMFDRMA